MACNARKFVRVTKFLLAGVTVFCVSWIASVNEWHGGVRWRERGGGGEGASASTMRTIVAYSEGKQAELDRPLPVTCDSLPARPTVPHINRTWSPGVDQKSSWQRVVGTKMYLYSAYYDERLPQRYIRILASFHGRNFLEEPLYCQTRQLDPYEDTVEVVAARPLEIWYHQWGIMSAEYIETPILLSCPLTGPLYYPTIVSVVTEPCNEPTNAFPIEPRLKNEFKRNFTICVKDMNFDKDISQRILEWIETNIILGVDMIDMYVGSISKESENVLFHYRNKGYVRLFYVPINDKPKRSLWQQRRDHIITYNDCLYRNIAESEYVIPLDVDEIVLPKIAYTWPELIERLKYYGWNSSHNSAILVRNVFFFDFLQNIHSYKHRRIPTSQNKIYTKRDDVRIRETNNIDLDEIELVDSTDNLSDEVIDNSDERLYKEYKERCGKELPLPKLMKHVVSSALVSPVGYYGKSLMVTKQVLTAFNHYPLASLGGPPFNVWSAPFREVQLNHYKESCNTTLVVDCAEYGRRARIDRSAHRLSERLTRALANAICTPINIT